MKSVNTVCTSTVMVARWSRLKSRIVSLYSRNWLVIAPMLFVAFGLFGVNEAAWGYDWYARVGVSQGEGSAYIEIYNNAITERKVTKTSATTSGSVVFCKESVLSRLTEGWPICHATSADGYYFEGWYYDNGKVSENANYNTHDEDGVTLKKNWDRTYYAKFAAVTVSSVASNSNSTSNPLSFTYPRTQTATVVFNVSHADETADFDTPTISGDGWSLNTWSYSNNQITVLVDFTANSSTTKGTHTATVTLTSKGTSTSQSKDATVAANVDLTPTLTYSNAGSVDVSVSDADRTELNLATLLTAYKGADNVAGDGTITYSLKTANSDVSLTSAGIFYAKATGTYTIVASAAKGRYYAKMAEFTVSVGKRTPTFVWNAYDHIYASDVLENVAQARYAGNNVNGLSYSYSSANTNVVVVDGNKLRVQQTGFNAETYVEITVNTDSTTCYKAGEAKHTYKFEPKATPVFKLNGEVLPASPVQRLDLLIGDTASMTFENTDESNGNFEYPVAPFKFVKYEHNSGNHAGVITGIEQGDKTIQFHQKGTSTIFDHERSIHVYVHKHDVTLTTTLNGGTWKVDSVYTGVVYSVNAPEAGEPVQNTVTVNSSDENVLKLVDGGWKAVGAGTATLTIAQKNNDYWTGDTITAIITVEQYTPVITWNLESEYAWGSQIVNPVRSTCELPFTLTSSDPTKADYVNGKIEVYNKNGNVTFTLTQEGNYKWADASSNLSYTFNCFKPANHVPMELKAGNYSQYKSYTTNNVSWSNSGVQCGTSGGGFNWDDKYIELHVTGVPHHLTFNYQTNNNVLGDPSGVEWFVQYKTETGDWSAKTTWNGNSGSKDFVLDPDVQYVRLCYSGNYGGLFTKVNISERKEIVAPASVTFPTNFVDASTNTQTINVNWYNVKHSTVTITGTNASFFSLADDSHEIASAIDDYGTKALKVRYAYPEGGTHTATLHIESEDGYTANVPLSATSNKLTPAITWKENLTPMSRGENVVNPATSPVTLVYESSDSTVVDVEGSTLKPLKKGTATITASFNGTTDKKYNSNSSTIDVLVTDMKVLHINWPQTFTRLKYSAEKPEKTTADFELMATVSYFDPDTKEEISIDRAVTFTSSNNAVVQVLPGNILHVAGLGTTATLTAHVDGVENEFIEANVIRAVKVREPSTDCDTYVLEDAHNSMLTEINSFNGVETEYALSGEPGYLTFSAWTEKWYLGKLGIDPSGDMKVAQFIDGEWSDAIWSNSLEIGNEKPFGPLELDRRATKIKFYKEVGSTCYHNFSEGYVTLARYVELENTPNKTTLDIACTTDETKPGVAVVKTFTVNYSNITDQLVIDYEGSNKFSILSPASKTIGEECGDKGSAVVQVQFLSDDVDHYEGVITIHNENQSVTINLSADVDMHHQQIEWNAETLSLKTTDDVTFDATTTGSAAGLSVHYSVTAGGDVATVDATTGKLTILKDGDVTVQADADGNNTTYYAADSVSYTFHISKVTPSITTIPTAATMTMPNTNLGSCGLTGGEATVYGSFSWADSTINATLNNEGYTVVFTPDNKNWYNTTSCIVVVPVNKQVNTITWDFDVTEMYCNAEYTFDATATSGLDVYYETSDASVAYVDDANNLKIVKGGVVTITAYQDGDENWDAAEPIEKILTINRFAPTIVTYPSAKPMKIGRLLSDATLKGGVAKLNEVPVPGSFAWVDGNTTPMDVAGTFSKQIVFKPSNENYYEPVYGWLQVTVEKYAPVIEHTLHGSDITYGQALSSSILSGTLTATDTVKLTNVEVNGTYAWLSPSAVVNAGNPTKALVRFSPNNTDWYDVVDFEVPVNVAKAAPVLNVTASEIAIGQTLSQSHLTNNGTAGICTWDPSLNAATTVYSVEGDYADLPFVFTSTDPNYTNGAGVVTLHVNIGFVFNGADGDWDKGSNWQNGNQPGETDNVLVNADVDIDGSITVGSLTIAEGVDVTVKNGGLLTINGSSLDRETYGNLHVENGGQVIFGEGEVQVNDFTLEAKLGDANNVGMSGQVQNPATLKVRGNAYFDLALDPSGECSPGWYDFTVPFPVDALNGVTRFDNSTHEEKTIKNEVNYAIMDYSENRRVVGGYGWKKYRSIMQPGKCYTITIDDVDNVYRFKMVKDGSFNNQMNEVLAYTDVESEHNGWNGLGNGTLAYTNLSASGIEKVQVYSHSTNSYMPVNIDEYTYVVGSTYFVQAPAANSEITYTHSGANHTLRAPKRYATTISEFTLSLTNEVTQKETDRLYVGASEDAMDTYTAGRELTKFATPTEAKTAQIWANAYGLQLCDIEMPLIANKANTTISFFAPQAGLYEIAVEHAPEDATLYLTKSGKAIWNLSMSPCELNLEKGTTEGYGLRIVAREQTTTDIENVDSTNGEGIRKVMIDNVIYLITPDGKMYDIVGKSVKY